MKKKTRVPEWDSPVRPAGRNMNRRPSSAGMARDLKELNVRVCDLRVPEIHASARQHVRSRNL